jgi:hypothetical protein
MSAFANTYEAGIQIVFMSVHVAICYVSTNSLVNITKEMLEIE